jgi:hypothetical protein
VSARSGQVAFTESDQADLSVLASVVADAIEAERSRESSEEASAPRAGALPSRRDASTHVRFFAVDGSTFLGDDYLIKGVAGRILWSLLATTTGSSGSTRSPRPVHSRPVLEYRPLPCLSGSTRMFVSSAPATRA